MSNYTLHIAKLNSSKMKILLKQEDKDVRLHIQQALKRNNTDLSKACRIAGMEYSEVYRRLNRELIDYTWLCEFMAEVAPNVELVLDLKQ